MPTTIVFSCGERLTVKEEPSKVMDALTSPEPFHQLTGTDENETPVYLGGDPAIAYLFEESASQEPLVSFR